MDIPVQIEKADAGLGCVFGWAAVSSVDGEPHFDLQGEHAPVDVLAKALADAPGRVVTKAMHSGDITGEVVFALPIYEDGQSDIVSKSGKAGVYIGARFAPDVLAKFESGEYSGFSIAGSGTVEEVED